MHVVEYSLLWLAELVSHVQTNSQYKISVRPTCSYSSCSLNSALYFSYIAFIGSSRMSCSQRCLRAASNEQSAADESESRIKHPIWIERARNSWFRLTDGNIHDEMLTMCGGMRHPLNCPTEMGNYILVSARARNESLIGLIHKVEMFSILGHVDQLLLATTAALAVALLPIKSSDVPRTLTASF